MPSVCRHKSLAATGHKCDPVVPIIATARSVKVGGKRIGRMLDKLMPHTIPAPCPPGPCCIPHPAKVNVGSRSVFAEGIPVARIGDSADGGRMITGNRNGVFAG
jgi:uncharacterized Zn-binding protein involved in type VI secretion